MKDKKIEEKGKTCGICEEIYYGFGNNAEPVSDVRCCDLCNDTKVIPARIKAFYKGRNLNTMKKH